MLLFLGLLIASTTGCSSSFRSSSEAKTASPVPAPTILHDKVEVIPSLDARLTELAFFGSSAADISPLKNPTHKSRFEHTATTRVYPEIHLEYPPPERKSILR